MSGAVLRPMFCYGTTCLRESFNNVSIKEGGVDKIKTREAPDVGV